MTRAREIHDGLDHPIIDGDGHILEVPMVLLDYVKQVAGAEVAERFENRELPETYRGIRSIFWGMPSGPHTLDRATAMLPKLYAERLDDAGIDHGIVYSTNVLAIQHIRDDEIRQVGHRALNTMFADIFSEVGHKLTPSAAIPMYSPAEALAELDYAVGELGFKAATFGTELRIAPPDVLQDAPHLAKDIERVHPVAMDSLEDYDPVWQKCLDMKIAVASHTSGRGGMGRRSSPSNYVFNHLGDFAESANYFCRCVFMGGVTRRFPGLNFGFLEGGVGWAAQLYNDIIEHWEKRNIEALQTNLDPSKLDLDLMAEMARKYGGNILTAEALCDQPKRGGMGGILKTQIELDEFKALEITNERDIIDLFIEPFYFGCEADDRINGVAFDGKLNHWGAHLKAIFSSDIGHWDVTDMNNCVPDAYGLVEDGVMDDDAFRSFMFGNIVEFFTKQNPDFFKGTSVEAEVSVHLGQSAAAA